MPLQCETSIIAFILYLFSEQQTKPPPRTSLACGTLCLPRTLFLVGLLVFGPRLCSLRGSFLLLAVANLEPCEYIYIYIISTLHFSYQSTIIQRSSNKESTPAIMSSDEDSESDAEQRATGEKNPAINTDNWPNEDPDVMRIMLSTDNHLGYAERDVVRGMDSFAAFEEVLYLAKKFNCDMVLIAGDLFHDNRPSRGTLHRTMEILRRYCMGPEAVKIEFLSDAAAQLQSAVTVNYQDANYAVGLPLFSIHGNHDDPSRDQGGGDLLAALDLLAISNLINYFGRQDEVDKVEISPLLLQKGTTKVALFGLGSLRDERLNRMWEQKKVRFLRPEMDDDDDDGEESFFNIFTLHQNRDLGRGSKNCVQESMIPDWMDLVVWVSRFLGSICLHCLFGQMLRATNLLTINR